MGGWRAEMTTITCPKCSTEIMVVPYGFGEIGVYKKCGYLHNKGKEVTVCLDSRHSIT
jgi:hypothetical protein